MRDTIHALATAPGRSAVAVMRVSGPRAGALLRALAGEPPPARRASLRTLRCGGERLDEALILWMPGPRSFTGEDAVELHLHGGRAVVEAVAQALASEGSRPAEPGEFTRRAFENGKLDLTEAEGVADLVDAETDAQRRQALAQLGGRVADQAASWRRRLLHALAHLEAAVDFPDEDLPEDVAARATPELLSLRDELQAAAADRRGEQVRNGLRIALLGAPNAGKSSLLNALARRDVAIVTPRPGTTRDVIEVRLDLSGIPCTLADTAGLRESEDAIEAEGVRRARAWAFDADLRLWVVDAASAPPAVELASEHDWIVATKMDLSGASPQNVRNAAGSRRIVEASAVAPAGVDGLEGFLRTWAAEITSGDEPPVVTRTRHRERMLSAVAHLERAVYGQAAVELIAEDVRLAVRDLERLTGRIDADTVLAEIFSAFCIGK